MCRWREQQAGIRKQDRRTSAEHDRHQPDPTEAFERQALPQHVRQQKQSGDAETKRGDVPWCEARPEAEARHDDPSGPDADRRKAIEGTARIVCSRARIHAHLGTIHPREERSMS